MAEPPNEIWTIGHSTLALEVFVQLLQQNGIKLLADVRRFPGSRRFPHFSAESLSRELPSIGVEYIHFAELGGRRKPDKDSKNSAWRNDHFRAYADFMETEEFRLGIERLKGAASARNTAMMCAEAVWWRCHRGLLSDFFKSHGVRVWHIIGSKVEEHPYTGAARIVEGKLVYTLPEEQMEFGV